MPPFETNPSLPLGPKPPGHWVRCALLLLALSACDSGAPDPYAGCPTPIPLGCRCVSGDVQCEDGSGLTGGGTGSITGLAPTAGGAQEAGASTSDLASTTTTTGTTGTTGRETGTTHTTTGSGNTDTGTGSNGQTGATTSDDDGGTAGPPSSGEGFVGSHGALRVSGNRVVDQSGEAIQLRGMSWFWSQWTDFYVEKNVDVMVDDWQATLVRAAMGVENDGGYLQDPTSNVAKVRTLVDRAIERGIYVIIDWHDHHAQDHQAQATAFFDEMATAYANQPHVIFEIYNEPMDVPWPVVKSYAESLIATIRGTGANNLIIVGTPTWSQDVDVAAGDRITSDDNVAYTLHFYANTHRQNLRDKAETALDAGLALFVTEWGTCSADGNGSIDAQETNLWLEFLHTHSISWANWALNNKAEACSAVQPSGSSVGPWDDDQLTPSGLLVKDAIP